MGGKEREERKKKRKKERKRKKNERKKLMGHQNAAVTEPALTDAHFLTPLSIMTYHYS